jgi:uncharacterized protein YjcR
MGATEETWWSAKTAASKVGCDPETIRNWARTDKVARRNAKGGRTRQEFRAADVLAVAGLEMDSSPDEPMADLKAQNAALVERNSVLDEVLRRYRLIEERRDEIDRYHREIEELLQGSAPIPNN